MFPNYYGKIETFINEICKQVSRFVLKKIIFLFYIGYNLRLIIKQCVAKSKKYGLVGN